MNTLLKINLGVSPHFLNKDNRAPLRPQRDTGELSNKWAFGAFSVVCWSSMEIMRHVTAGKAISVGAFTRNWRHQTNFASSQLMGVDFDNGPDVDGLLQDDFVQQYAFLCYATASSTDAAPRSRALFMLDQTITDQALWKKLMRRLLYHFDSADIDEACKDPVRIFYGSDKPGHSFAANAVLPLAVLESLEQHPSEKPQPRRELPPASISSQSNDDRYRRYTDVSVQRILDTLGSTMSGRNGALNKAAFALGRLVSAHWSQLNRYDVETALYNTAVANGYVSKDGESDARATIASGLNAGMAQPAEPPQSQPREKRNNPQPHSAAPAGEGNAPAPAAPVFNIMDCIVSSKQALDRYKDRLSAETAPEIEPVVIPFTVLHQFGGYARVIMPGKMIGLAGRTGGGKTTFVDSIVDMFRQNGVDALVYSPEWSSDESADRMGQRYGGPTMEEMYLWQVWKAESAAGVDAGTGIYLPSSKVNSGIAAADQVAHWPGEAFYIDRARISLNELLDGIEVAVKNLREKGRNVRLLVIDYAQMLKVSARDERARTLNDAISLIKDLCIDLKLVGLVVSQVNKQDSRDNSNGGKLLDENSAQFLRFDEFNLAMTLNMEFDEQQKPTGKGTINVIKNSIGRKGAVKVFMNLSRGAWLDKQVEVIAFPQVMTDDEHPF